MLIIDRILREIAKDEKIPKPVSRKTFTFKGEDPYRGERAIYYAIPDRKNPDRWGGKHVTASQLQKAYDRLCSGLITKSWWKSNVAASESEGGCNFTTTGGLFVLLEEAEYAGPGIYRAKPLSQALQRALATVARLPVPEQDVMAAFILGKTSARPLNRLSPGEQDDIAAHVLEEIDERRWQEAFAGSREKLRGLAAKAREDVRAGRVKAIGIDEL